MIILYPQTNSHTLKSELILSIKKTISVETGRFTFDISDAEVFDRVNDEYNERKLTDKKITWQKAAECCMDDWGVCEALGYC